jgi:predicted Zn-dependent protease
MGFMGLMQQLQINHTRSNEHEADRVGIRTLASAGYEPLAMASFFGRMQRANRTVGIGVPEYLRSHPVTSTRISEAKDRAKGLPTKPEVTMRSSGHGNPLLPDSWLGGVALQSEAGQLMFPWARERLRVMTAESPIEMETHYRRLLDSKEQPFTAADHYGYALALKGVGSYDAALAQLDAIDQPDPGHFWVPLARAELLSRSGRLDQAEALYEKMLASHSRNRAVALSYASALLEGNSMEQGRRAQAVLRPLMSDGANDPALQRSFGRASEVAGDLVRAGEAHAEYAYLTGSAPDAVKQLEALKLREDLDYYQRARIDARIAAMTPTALEMERSLLRNPNRLQPVSHQSLQ